MRPSLTLSAVLFFLVQSVFGTDRIALVIGNADYQTGPVLRNPVNDATDVAAALESCGFTLVGDGPVVNLGNEALHTRLEEFRLSSARASVALFFFAGHGVEVDGANYLLPVDGKVEAKFQVKLRTLALEEVLGAMADGDEKLNGDEKLKIVILDCCRDNPLVRSWSRNATGGLVMPAAIPGGTVLFFATAPGKTAEDGTERNSPFSAVLKTAISTPGRELEQIFKAVGAAVKRNTEGFQEPWMHSSFYGKFIFSGTSTTEEAEMERIVAENERLKRELAKREEQSKRDLAMALTPTSTPVAAETGKPIPERPEPAAAPALPTSTSSATPAMVPSIPAEVVVAGTSPLPRPVMAHEGQVYSGRTRAFVEGVGAGYVDFARLQLDFFRTDFERRALEAKRSEKLVNVNALRARFNELVDAQNADATRLKDPTLSESGKTKIIEGATERQAMIVSVQKELIDLETKVNAELKAHADQVQQSLTQEIYFEIGQVAEAKGYDVVLNRSFGISGVPFVAYSSTKSVVDFTDEVSARLNRNAPAGWTPPKEGEADIKP